MAAHAIRYTENNQNYYVVGRMDFGSHLISEDKMDASDQARLVKFNSENEASLYLLTGLLDEIESIGYPHHIKDLKQNFLDMIKENQLEDFQRNLITYNYSPKHKKNPLEDLNPRTKEVVNKVLEDFSFIEIQTNFAELIISGKPLTPF